MFGEELSWRTESFFHFLALFFGFENDLLASSLGAVKHHHHYRN